MPTVNINRDDLFRALGKTYTEQEFDELCFEYGLELDKVTEEPNPETNTTDTIYSLDIPANRYDLLCIEGLSQALSIFQQPSPQLVTYRLKPATIKIKVKCSAKPLRPFIVGAILRNVDLSDNKRYKSLIDLQDKLHQNICRRRSLVAIGTHDLAAVEGPFMYECRSRKEICFKPLNQDREMDGDGVIEFCKDDQKLREYVPLIEKEEKVPLVSDSRGNILSLPPLINGDLSKISTETKDIFVECTATDYTKAIVVLNIVVSMFSRYCKEKFEVEAVDVEYEESGEVKQTPDFTRPKVSADVDYIGECVGVHVGNEEIVKLLKKMQLPAVIEKNQGKDGKAKVTVDVPIIRSDVIHACDIMTDVAIAFGFNNIPEKVAKTSTVGGSQPLNSLSDGVRHEGLMAAGYTEVLTWVTVSHEENFDSLQRPDDGKTAVRIGNPKRLEFQECRTSLLPGLLKTLRENRKVKIPIQIFEVGDVILKDDTAEVRAKNQRRLAAVRCSTSAGFEVVKGLLDHIMQVFGVSDWCLKEEGCTDECFFKGRRADIWWKNSKVGTLGWLHPQVLKNYELVNPCSAVEMDLEPFL